MFVKPTNHSTFDSIYVSVLLFVRSHPDPHSSLIKRYSYFTVWSGTRSAGWDEAWPLVSGPRRSTLIFSVYSWFATSNPELSFGTDYLCVIYSRCKSNSFVDGVGWVWMHHYSTSTLISQSIRILYHEWNRQNVPRGGAVQDTETVDTRLSLRLAPLDPRSRTARMYQT
jgi:hypothetical protein